MTDNRLSSTYTFLAVPVLLVVLAVLIAVASVPLAAEDAARETWPSFRGERAAGVADGHDLPESWDITSGQNVRWRVPVPGQGHSSPVVWRNRLFLTTAVAPGSQELRLGDSGIGMADSEGRFEWRVLAFDTDDGSVLWNQQVAAGTPRAGHHVKSSQANPTPATNGEVVAVIVGSEGLFVLDAASGKQKWRKDLGVNDPGLLGDENSNWGAASSPIIWRDRVFVQVDRHAESFLAAYRLSDGAELWRNARDEMPVWSTPTVLETEERVELVVIGGRNVRGIDPMTGTELWRFTDQAEVKTPTPFAADDLIVIAGGYRGRPIYALKTGGRGDLTVPDGEGPKGNLAWRTGPGGPYTTTPIAYRDLVFSVRDTGILNVYDLATGENKTRMRLNEHFSASPVASDGRLYFSGEDGSVIVVSAEAAPKVLSTVEMNEPLMASPAIADGTLYLRTTGHLHAIATMAETGEEMPGKPAT